MDKDTRNAIERATQRARRLLEDDFVSQLEGTFDVLLSGEVAATGGPHLTPQQRVVREKIVAAVEHKRAAGAKPGDAVAGYARDAAFTTLNRFVALKMLEARGLLQECITKGDLSSGYKEFCGLAPGVTLLPDGAGYRLYVECLFDELSTEIKVLFDRRDPASALWPKRATFEELLAVLNAPELASVWGEDETIGWVYQFFNSGDERRAMREESQAPRNSRELAVRNQFFTPRYVVRFLTENTLGRTWIEMMGEKTRLAERCEFLVTGVESRGPRARKDPRDIRILDPACGSGHFLLYAFDLLLPIYEEAWADPDAAPRATTGRKLAQDYPDLDGLRRAIPGLILAENLHGVDIDPRCAQIAALALWLRAQRAFQEFGVKPSERQRITRTHIVVAEPMPGDAALVETFAEDLQPPLLGGLFRKMVAEMRLAGELGSLIRVDKGIVEELERARQQWNRDRDAGDLLPGLDEYRVQAALDLSYINDEGFFEEAEASLLAALRRFAESAAGGAGVRRRLFAGDALQGMALIDLLQTRFDVVLMNPPFGGASERVSEYLDSEVAAWSRNYASAFVARAFELTIDQGFAGILVDTTIVQKSSYERFRRTHLFENGGLVGFAWLGWGVMDAQVDATLLLLRKALPAKDILCLDARENPETLLREAALTDVPTRGREVLSEAPHLALTALFNTPVGHALTFRENLGVARQGVAVPDAFRFIRAWWEPLPRTLAETKRWFPLSHGGEYSPFFRDYSFVVDWANDGERIKKEVCIRYPYLNGNWAWVVRNAGYYLQPGLGYGKRTDSFNTQVAPRGLIFSNEGSGIFPLDWRQVWFLLGVTNSTVLAEHLNSFCGQHKYSGYVDKMVVPTVSPEAAAAIADAAREGYLIKRRLTEFNERSRFFSGPSASCRQSVRQWLAERKNDCEAARARIRVLQESIDSNLFGRQSKEPARIDASISDDWGPERIVSYGIGLCFGRRPRNMRLPSDLSGIELDDLIFSALPDPETANEESPAALLDDRGSKIDIVDRLSEALAGTFSTEPGPVLEQLAHELFAESGGEGDLRRWVGERFFSYHLDSYRLGRRKAPIYWQLATQSASYSVWLYAHRVTSDSFFHVQNECLVPKLAHEERRLAGLVADGGANPSSILRKEIDRQETFVQELRALRAEVARIAPLWHPDLNDGVLLTMAPLWRLVPQHRAWQKELRSAWESLASGTYDWSHLAMHLWPERVIPKCATDRSLAIAHGLEDVFWMEGSDGKWTARAKPTRPMDELVRERSSMAVKAALQSLVDAPAPQGTSKAKRAKGAR